jgi:hypothetical protein
MRLAPAPSRSLEPVLLWAYRASPSPSAAFALSPRRPPPVTGPAALSRRREASLLNAREQPPFLRYLTPKGVPGSVPGRRIAHRRWPTPTNTTTTPHRIGLLPPSVFMGDGSVGLQHHSTASASGYALRTTQDDAVDADATPDDAQPVPLDGLHSRAPAFRKRCPRTTYAAPACSALCGGSGSGASRHFPSPDLEAATGDV